MYERVIILSIIGKFVIGNWWNRILCLLCSIFEDQIVLGFHWGFLSQHSLSLTVAELATDNSWFIVYLLRSINRLLDEFDITLLFSWVFSDRFRLVRIITVLSVTTIIVIWPHRLLESHYLYRLVQTDLVVSVIDHS